MVLDNKDRSTGTEARGPRHLAQDQPPVVRGGPTGIPRPTDTNAGSISRWRCYFAHTQHHTERPFLVSDRLDVSGRIVSSPGFDDDVNR